MPLESLLDRFSQVDENGIFFTSIPDKEKRFALQLGALSGGRISISAFTPGLANNALTIASRYVCIRK